MLLKEENIVLFTPAVAPLYQPGRDPFEPLGRALSKHHSRIRHVPYVHEMTHEHLTRLREAHAVVVVVCDAGGSAKSVIYDNGGAVKCKGSNLEEQVAFAKAVNRTIMDDEGDMFHLPVILVLVTEDPKEKYRGQTLKDNLIHTFGSGTVVHCGSYSTDALERVADRIFDHDVIDRARERDESLGMDLD
ncbi:hypothetical protein EJ05DRAFT_488701 [Pseudovirgaria hyperparasitica]|uniref:Uncharacterized protein n=1 Tax=Pseudovirgaria hyperparasitica TaxID=470096 RepID=A0A6A6VWV6_9PEZI|nr:uncharacterized protein EJ05DRAFT_488701 [Pseudovirgaria hyperparasitica]KAF2755168.1 hypothetical protein EJ05DRAFT_488701 [Pseudovirgaria hyperparasitica]